MNMPPLFRAALALIGLSLVLFLAGFASNFWFVSSQPNSSFHFGLWLICTSSYGCVNYDRILGTTPAHAYVARFCTIYEMIAVIVGLVLLCLFVCKSAQQRWARSSYSLLLSAGITGFLGAIIFIGREKSLDSTSSVSVSWSGILVIFAAIMQIVSGVLILLPIRRGQVEFEQV